MSNSPARIKICGITNRDDARAAVDYGADALGFIFVPETPRYVGDKPEIGAILEELPPFVTPVAVCKAFDQAPDPMLLPFHTVQFYRHDLPDAAQIAHRRLVPAFRIQDVSSLDAIAAFLTLHRPHAILLDAYHKDRLGGSGETFNWDLALEAKARFAIPLILAGGLTPDNVGDAIAAVRPYAVDVSSGVEAEPGRKDHARLRAFIRAVRKANAPIG